MVFRFDDSKQRLTRHDLADPNRHVTLEQRLAEIGAPDLRNNAHVVERGGDYATILPVNPAKSWTLSSPRLAEHCPPDSADSPSQPSESPGDSADNDDDLSK